MIGELILVAYHVVVLDAVEFSFKLPDFGAICIHEAFDAKLNDYTESVETCFIFGGVVGGQKVYPENVSELILGRRNE